MEAAVVIGLDFAKSARRQIPARLKSLARDERTYYLIAYNCCAVGRSETL